MNAEALKSEFVDKYKLSGEIKFYKILLVYALNQMTLLNEEYDGIIPDLELLDYYDQFIILYRREGESTYLDIAKLFRRAAHKAHRLMLKKNLITKNVKFLSLV